MVMDMSVSFEKLRGSTQLTATISYHYGRGFDSDKGPGRGRGRRCNTCQSCLILKSKHVLFPFGPMPNREG